jgi:Homeodomain-like domain
MSTMNKKYLVSLTGEEEVYLKGLIQVRKTKGSVVLNAQILLCCDKNGANSTDELVAKTYHVSAVRVQRVREKFVLHGLQIALRGLPRGPKNKHIKIDGEVEAHLVQLACSEAPAGHNRWTLRLLADKIVELNHVESISYEGVRQVLKKTNLSLGKK